VPCGAACPDGEPEDWPGDWPEGWPASLGDPPAGWPEDVLGDCPPGDCPEDSPASPGEPPAGRPEVWPAPVSGACPVSPVDSEGGWGQRSGAGSPLVSPELSDGLPDVEGVSPGLADGLPGEPSLDEGLDDGLVDGLELPGLPGDPGLPCEPDGGDEAGGCGGDWLVSLGVAQPPSASAPASASPIHESCLRHIGLFSVNAKCPGAARRSAPRWCWIKAPGRWFNATRRSRLTGSCCRRRDHRQPGTTAAGRRGGCRPCAAPA
jgi:hypothetical protein